ncbi:MAG: PilZ domain-containing protein [Hyphomicrobiales bacterium]|nr:MAG: PilZ domain-containing protein [Hyphomicrobiales bacterium]
MDNAQGQEQIRKRIQEMAEELRNSPRRRVVKQAKVVYGNFMFVLDCYIRDLSEDGARLKIDNPSEVPDQFHLFIPSEYLIFKSHVRWKKDGEIGIEFDGLPRNVLTDTDPRLSRFKFSS